MFNKVTNEQMLEDCFKIRKEVFVKEQHVAEDHEIDEYIGKVERVAILKEYRGLGLGLKLLTFIETIAREHHLTRLTMHAQYYATPFYEKLGYITSGRPFYEENIKHIVMNKNMIT